MKIVQRSIAVACTLALSTASLPAQTLEPLKPEYGKKISFRYSLPSLDAVVKPIQSVSLIVYKSLFDVPETVFMQKKDTLWTVQYAVSDTSVKMFFFEFRIQDEAGRTATDNAKGQLYDAFMHLPGGKPVLGAREARALSFTGFSDKREENPEQALNDVQQELTDYPFNLSARSLYYSILLKQSQYAEPVRDRIAKNIRSLISLRPKDASVLQFSADAYRMIDRTGEAEKIEKELIRNNPRSVQAAQKALSEILPLEDARVRVKQLEEFRVRFPGASMDEFVLSQIVSAALEAEDHAKIVQTGDLLLRKAAAPSGANALAASANMLADRTIELNRAESYAKRALSLVQSASISSAERNSAEWKEQNRRTEARYRDVLGWVYLQKGLIDSAKNEFDQASMHTFQANVFYHLGVWNERSRQFQEAMVHFGKAAAFGGQTGERSLDALRKLWIRAGKDTTELDAFLDEQESWVETRNRELVLSKRISRPAPDFKLEDASGGFVRLSAQLGNPVVLCFWAGWSQSSLPVLETVQELTRAYGSKVLFVTISTEKEKPKLQKLPNGERFFLPVLIGNGIEKTYGIQGVPFVYVIDGAGQIRFEHKGYRPDLIQVLSIELEDVLVGKP